MRRVSALVVIVVAVAVGGPSAGPDLVEPSALRPAAAAARLEALRGPAKVEALVEAVVEQQRALRSLRAEFTQTTASELLLDPVESAGSFRFLAPDRVRWDYREPDRMIVVFADDTVTTYHPDEKRAERIRIAAAHRRFVQALAGTQPLDDLSSQFSITLSDPGPTGPYRLLLTPTHRALKRKLETVRLEVDRQLLLPVAVEYRSATGDSTRYEFRQLELNPELEASGFVLVLGDGVAVQEIDASG